MANKYYRQNLRNGTNPTKRKSNIAKIMETFGPKKKDKKEKPKDMYDDIPKVVMPDPLPMPKIDLEFSKKIFPNVIDDDAFWSESKFSNIWAIQYQNSVTTDEVEYRDETPHSSYADANLGDVSQFITRWDAAHLNQLQIDWDDDNEEGETSEEKIARLGPRPTSYSS